MAINVPVQSPNPVQPVNPFPIVDSYLNRQQQAQQAMGQSAVELGQTYNQLRQQRIQNQLGALGAYAGIAKAVGPDTANQVAGNIPFMPNWGNVYQQPPQNSQPQQPLQTQTMPENQIDQSGATGPSPYIAASVNAGHPDITGHMAKFQNPQGTQNPPLTSLSDQIAELNSQMAKYANKGEWGMEQQKQLSDRIAGLKAQQETANAPQQFSATQTREANQFQTTKQQELNAKREAIEKDFQAKNESINSAIDAIQSSLQLKAKADTEAGPLKGRLATAKENFMGQGPTYDLNRNNEFQRTKLQHVQEVNRFNPEEVQYIGGGSLAQPIEPLATSLSKGQNAVDAFNRQLIRNQQAKNAQLRTLGLPEDNTPIPKINLQQWLTQNSQTGQQGNGTAITSQSQYDALPNGASYTFNGKPHVKGKS